MRRRPVRFFSDRLALDGDLWLPDGEPTGPLPAIVSASGYQGLKTIHPERFARSLVPQGFACLSFDYRGFGASEGERGRLVPQDWVADLRAAVSFMESVDEVDTGRLALLGWALGGGAVIAEAADDPRVRAVAACNAIADGYRSTKAMHGQQEWEELLTRIAADRRRTAVNGRSQVVHPFDIVALDKVTKGYVDAELYRAAGFGNGVTLESADRLLHFRPVDVIDRIAPRPLLLVHGKRNELHFPAESEDLYDRAGDNAELVLLEDSGHTEWMFDDHPTYGRFMAKITNFLTAALT